VSRIFYQTHLAPVGPWRSGGSWRKRRLAPHDQVLFGVRQDILGRSRSFHFFPWTGIASTKAPVASMLNHLTKRYREWPDRPHGMRIYDSIGGLRLVEHSRYFLACQQNGPLSLAEISRYFVIPLPPFTCKHKYPFCPPIYPKEQDTKQTTCNQLKA
jgi:hypothetical protein